MKESQISVKVKAVMSREWNINIDDIPDDVEINQFKSWDSLGHISLILALQKEFEFDLSPDLVQNLMSLKSIVSYLSSNDNN